MKNDRSCEGSSLHPCVKKGDRVTIGIDPMYDERRTAQLPRPNWAADKLEDRASAWRPAKYGRSLKIGARRPEVAGHACSCYVLPGFLADHPSLQSQRLCTLLRLEKIPPAVAGPDGGGRVRARTC